MSNPFPNQFDSNCQRCEKQIKKDQDVFAVNGKFICERCAKENDNICECGNFKKAEYEVCFTCKYEGEN